MAVKKKAIIIPIAAVAVIGAGAFFVHSTMGAMNAAMAAVNQRTAVKAGNNDLTKTISSTGRVIGNGTVEVTTNLTAEISEVNVSLGDHVSEGDVLCVFDSTKLQEQYDTLSAQLGNSDKRTESAHDKNKRDLEDAKTKKQTALLRAQRTINEAVKARDDAYAAYNALVADYNAHVNGEVEEDEEMPYDFDAVDAELETMYAGLSEYDKAVTAAYDAYSDTEAQYNEQIQSIQDLIDAEEYEDGTDYKQLDELQEQIDNCTVYAPQDGIITVLNVNEGSIPSSVSLMTIVNTDETVIEFTLKETDINKISEGMEATVTSKVLPDKEMKGKVTRIVHVMSQGGDMPAAASGDDGSGFKAEVTLDTAEAELLIGMSASVEIKLDDTGVKLSVPYSGVFEEDDKSYIYIAEPVDGEEGAYTAKKITITTGEESDFYIEVKDGDVKEGDLVIEDPLGSDMVPAVKDGERVTLNE